MVVGVVAAVLVPVAARVAIEGRNELAAAEQARARADVDARIEHLGRALRWRLPLGGADEVALDRLEAIAAEHEALGPPGREVALAAHREIRRGLLATRVLGIPHRERWERANERIAALMAEQEQAMGIERSAGGDRTAHHLALLSREPGPAPVRGHLAALAFGGWVLSVVAFVLRGIGPKGRLRPRLALRWGLGAVVLLVAWAVLLATAHG